MDLSVEASMEQRIIISKSLKSELATAISECEHDGIFILTDETTLRECWPVMSRFLSLKNARMITIGASDSHKDLDTIARVWEMLGKGGATRHSLLINLGGGMVTDLGGFAASTFKRGINFINIPTTLLAMVDASVGGKTGINFNGLKNEIGVFNDSKFVILDTDFLKTLDEKNICSGYAEMLKHGLIANKNMWTELMNRARRPNGERTPQGFESRAHLRPRFRELGLEAHSDTSWLRCSIRPDSRALFECCQNRVPNRTAATDGRVHPRILRNTRYHLR